VLPSDSTPAPNRTDDAPAHKPPANFAGPPAADEAGNLAFTNWKDAHQEFTLYDRVLISIISVSYVQSCTASTTELNQYLDSLSIEIKNALMQRAEQILLDYKKEIHARARETDVKNTWIESAKYGITEYLDDFAQAQIRSFVNLDALVREKTSIKSQAALAFGVALALAIFVGAVRRAVTIWDDIKEQIWSSAPAKTPTKPTAPTGG
jgi:hypothetical protein